jgi:hypothetical protein
MKTIKKVAYSFLLFSLGLPFQRAFSQESTVKKVENLNASTTTVYFNLENGAEVNAADTATNSWDISFQRTKVELQASASGQLLENSAFDKIEKAPAEGFLPGKAGIPNGSGKGWYLYNFENHDVSPIPGKVILVHTKSGKYVKLVIDSYYKTGADGTSGYYTFRYSFIPPNK